MLSCCAVLVISVNNYNDFGYSGVARPLFFLFCFWVSDPKTKKKEKQSSYTRLDFGYFPWDFQACFRVVIVLSAAKEYKVPCLGILL